MPQVTCQQCTTTFNAKSSWLKNGYGKFCSRNCASSHRKNGQDVACDVCNTQVYKSQKALKGSKSGKFFCGKSCQTTWRNQQFKGDMHPNWKEGKHAYRRMMHASERPKICGRCQTTDVRVLAVHHVDHDRSNNTLDNLVWLCHNCHHLTHHYPDSDE